MNRSRSRLGARTGQAGRVCAPAPHNDVCRDFSAGEHQYVPGPGEFQGFFSGLQTMLQQTTRLPYFDPGTLMMASELAARMSAGLLTRPEAEQLARLMRDMAAQMYPLMDQSALRAIAEAQTAGTGACCGSCAGGGPCEGEAVTGRRAQAWYQDRARSCVYGGGCVPRWVCP